MLGRLDAIVVATLLVPVVRCRQLALHRMLISLLALRVWSHALLPLALAILPELLLVFLLLRCLAIDLLILICSLVRLIILRYLLLVEI